MKKFNTAMVRAAIVLTIGIVVIGITAWKTYPRKAKATTIPAGEAKFMHCPDCDMEQPFDPKWLDAPCAACGSEKGWVLTRESITTASENNTSTGARARMIAFLLPEVVVMLGALWLVLRKRTYEQKEEYRYMRCPQCNGKLRYRAVQVGLLGACSKCKKPLRFPEGTPREQDLDGAYAYEHEEAAEED
jgi:hypothetical protein